MGMKVASRAPLLILLLAPVDGVVLTMLVFAEVLGRLSRRLSPQPKPQFPQPRRECSFVIVSWNSQAMLAESLPALLEALRNDGGNHEVIVVDNRSTDGTDEYINRQFPEIRLIRSEQNLYYGAGIRLGIASATRDILVLMNSDITVCPGFLEPLLQSLMDSRVFGVASQVLTGEGQSYETGNTHAIFDGSELRWSHDPLPSPETGANSPVFWLHRGLFAVDRRKYLWLGGLDSLYDPLHMEDVDLSYRAWKAGWSCLLEPASRVIHNHQLSVPSAGEGFLHMLVRRNQHIFFWKNISDLSMLATNLLRSTRTRIRRASIPGIGLRRELRSFFAALKRLPTILIRRVLFARGVLRSDREIFVLTARVGRNSSQK
jgi:O-antigen biosynthesis protein